MNLGWGMETIAQACNWACVRRWEIWQREGELIRIQEKLPARRQSKEGEYSEKRG